jgi:hypothetical protein
MLGGHSVLSDSHINYSRCTGLSWRTSGSLEIPTFFSESLSRLSSRFPSEMYKKGGFPPRVGRNTSD